MIRVVRVIEVIKIVPGDRLQPEIITRFTIYFSRREDPLRSLIYFSGFYDLAVFLGVLN